MLYLLLAEAYSLAFSGGGVKPSVGRSFRCRLLNCFPSPSLLLDVMPLTQVFEKEQVSKNQLGEAKMSMEG